MAVFYAQSESSFTQEACHNDNSARVITFLGDEISRAEDLLEHELKTNRKYLRGALDMEPLQVVAQMARDRTQQSIGGALQVAKVYASGHNEFFGIMWPSSNGEPYFMGRKLNVYDAPPMRFIDPDTAQFVDPLPQIFADLDKYDFGSETEFVRQCYGNGRHLKPTLTDAHRERLMRIMRDKAYHDFLHLREQTEQYITNESVIETVVPVDNGQEA
ncbi:MAG: hypothetical protein SH847_26710 [Roseiflexaceae bacterium]|nr:hypothetical protein [Roseiflexaceae bacterium]